jgi:uncharacterized protein YndB with AHSA1/START domain
MTTQIDPGAHAGLVRREVRSGERDGQPTRTVVAERTYRADRDDVWDAISNAERLPRWFLPISGELRVGGRYQLEGNAGGTIERCEKPELVGVTWEFGGGISWLEVQLIEVDGGTTLELRHEAVVEEHWKQFGPGAVGVGWDLSLLGLGLHLETGESLDPEEFQSWSLSEDGKDFIRLSSDGWGEAAVAAGDDRDHALAAAEMVRQFFTGEMDPTAGGEDPTQGEH